MRVKHGNLHTYLSYAKYDVRTVYLLFRLIIGFWVYSQCKYSLLGASVL